MKTLLEQLKDIRSTMLAPCDTTPIKESKLSILDVSDDTITLTKEELEVFLKDWDQGYGSWSDTSIKIVRFLGMDETDGL